MDTELLTLRPMQEADLLAYKALRDSMLERFPESFTSDAETERKRDLASYQSRLTGGGGGSTLFTLLACRGGRLVGALTLEREPRRKVQHIAHLIGMMVGPDQQGRGVGRTLLIEALRLLRADASIALVTLSVTASNAAGVRLYTSCGFERYGRLPGAIRLADGRQLDKDLMVLRLTD
jgi:ribosomal protein S18 acetylase RimI-like enzyme